MPPMRERALVPRKAEKPPPRAGSVPKSVPREAIAHARALGVGYVEDLGEAEIPGSWRRWATLSRPRFHDRNLLLMKTL